MDVFSGTQCSTSYVVIVHVQHHAMYLTGGCRTGFLILIHHIQIQAMHH